MTSFNLRPARRTQSGSVLVQFALLSLALLAILGMVQIGYMYSSKRDLQRIADLAALQAVQGFGNTSVCTYANAAGVQSIDRQWPIDVTAQGPYADMVKCGNWSTTTGFTPSLGDDGTYNAVRVKLIGKSLQLVPFTGSSTVQAIATAAIPKDDPQASFSIGAGVARLQAGPLNSVLTMLLGTDVNLSVADYTGLANTQIDLLGLKDAIDLSAGTYDELLDSTITIKQLLNTSIDLAQKGQQDSANVAISALEHLLVLMPVALQNTSIHLLKDGMQKGLLDLGLHQNNSLTALQADASALNLLLVGLQIANQDSALTLSNTDLNLSPLASINLQAKIIEPPVIASGRAGMDASGKYRTTAHSGQVRMAINLQALTPLDGNSNLLSPILGTGLSVSLPAGRPLSNLPIYVEVGSADGRLESIACYRSPNTHHVSIGAQPGLAHLLLALAPTAMTNTSLSFDQIPKDFFNLVGPLNIRLSAAYFPLIDAKATVKAKVDAALNSPQYEDLTYDYATDKPRSEQELIKRVGVEKKLGQSIGNTLNSNALKIDFEIYDVKVLGVINLDPVTAILNDLLGGLTTLLNGLLPLVNVVLNPIFALLDSVLGPVLQALGLQLGYADVELLTVDCNPQLVD